MSQRHLQRVNEIFGERRFYARICASCVLRACVCVFEQEMASPRLSIMPCYTPHSHRNHRISGVDFPCSIVVL